MPDRYGFNHEPHFGRVYHRCVSCDLYPWGVTVSVDERKRHFELHEKERLRRIERERRRNLSDARKSKAQKGKENDLAYGQSTIVD